jgi:BASS family bile acid:Na+ symporter
MEVLRSSSAALAPAIFGPWMNISGSIVANWWRRHPAREPERVGVERVGVGPQ